MTETAVITKVKINTDLKRPLRYSVIMFNDNVTTVEFVVQTLMEVFGHSYEAAIETATRIHEQGQGAVASGLAKELASHLRDLVIVKARAESYPLTTEIKEDAE
jgi:ATP-dependent Clp protease adaptor protein ClpS